MHLSSTASEPPSGQICVAAIVADRGRSDGARGLIDRAADTAKATPSAPRRHRGLIDALTLWTVQNSTDRSPDVACRGDLIP